MGKKVTMKMLSSILLLLACVLTVGSPLKCGVASTVFTQTPSAMSTAVDTGKLSFWWNWDTSMKIDNSTLNQSTLSGMHAAFAPMIWGTATPSDLSFLTAFPEGD